MAHPLSQTFRFSVHDTPAKRDLAMLEMVMKCDRASCPVAEYCKVGDGANCEAHKAFLRHIITMIYKQEACKKLDAHGVHTAGMLLIPLYTHLFRFQLVEMGLKHPVVSGKVLYVHPIFKEIRATLAAINNTWRALGLLSPVTAPDVKGFLKAKDVTIPVVRSATDDFLDAQGEFADAMDMEGDDPEPILNPAEVRRKAMKEMEAAESEAEEDDPNSLMPNTKMFEQFAAMAQAMEETSDIDEDDDLYSMLSDDRYAKLAKKVTNSQKMNLPPTKNTKKLFKDDQERMRTAITDQGA